MGSKVMLLLSICLIVALLISPEVTAVRDLLAPTSTNFKPEVAAKETTGTNDAKFLGYIGGGGYGYGEPGNGGYQYGGPGNVGFQYGEPGNGGYQYGQPGNSGYQYGQPGIGGSQYGPGFPTIGGSQTGGSTGYQYGGPGN